MTRRLKFGRNVCVLFAYFVLIRTYRIAIFSHLHVLQNTFETIVLVSDMASDEYANEGMSGVHCAVGSANQVRNNIIFTCILEGNKDSAFLNQQLPLAGLNTS